MSEQEAQTMALDVPRPENAVAVTPEPKTAQQCRVVEVNEALLPAYQKAATCEMSDEEIEAIMAPFPDECVEIRPHDGLIFLPHILISDRLNKVFKPGKWALIRRRDWFDANTNTMFGEYVLIIRGCYIGESVGGHPFVPTNAKTNMSDVLESTAAEALRRIAGKRLSCGSQVWHPEYARDWVSKYGAQVNGKWQKRFPTEQRSAPKPAKTADVLPKQATESTRKWMLEQLLAKFEGETVWNYAVAQKFICDMETLEDWPLANVPSSKQGLADLSAAIQNTIPKSEGTKGGDDLPEELASVVITIPRAGMKRAEYLKNPDTIGSLYSAASNDDAARKRLWGLAENWEPKEWEGNNGKMNPPSAADVTLREKLDAFQDWHADKEGGRV